MSLYQIILNNWQLYALIAGMILFVLSLLFTIIYSVAKQDNPDLPSPFEKEYWK